MATDVLHELGITTCAQELFSGEINEVIRRLKNISDGAKRKAIKQVYIDVSPSPYEINMRLSDEKP